MKKFSFVHLFASAFLTMVAAVFLSGTTVFADDAYYTGNYTPAGCPAMSVSYLTWPNDIPTTLVSNTIYVLNSGDYQITGIININSCVSLVASGTVTLYSTDLSVTSVLSLYNVGDIIIDGIKISWLNIPDYGILVGNAHNIVIRNTDIQLIKTNGIYFGNTSWSTIANNVIHDNTTAAGIFIDSSTDTTVSTNIITGNNNWLFLQNFSHNDVYENQLTMNTESNLHMISSDNNIFTDNTIVGGQTWVYLNMNSNNNTFINTYQSSTNNGDGIYIYRSSGNTFSGGYFSGNLNWIYLDYSNNNSFSTTKVTNNTYGTLLSDSSTNTITLQNNTNGIFLRRSDSNYIINTQIAGQNEIYIFSGANNIITWWLFSSASTTSTSVSFVLQNYQVNPSYSIYGAGMSGVLTGTMTWVTQAISITLTSGNGVKNITVEYNNGNTYNDNISLDQWWGNNWGSPGGWWGSGTPICVSTHLVCSGGVRVLKTGEYCQGGNLGHICTLSWTIQTGSIQTWTISTGNIFTGGSILGSPYSTEMNTAYLWAFHYGITTMPTIQQANMWSKLTRAHMAKMISVFAIRVAHLTPNTGMHCNFTDISTQSNELKVYIRLSCQLGLMWLKSDGTPNTTFNPTAQVTRAEFGTVLSRLLRWSTYNSGDPYYLPHLRALKNAGIMKNISTPNMKEIRWYVMLMMMRSVWLLQQ